MFDSSENNSILWLVIIFILLFGGGSFGGNNGALATEMQNGFNNQNVMGRFDLITQAINNSTYENAQLINNNNVSMLNGFAGINQTLNTGFDSVNANINNLSHQMSDCCCALKTQMLQDKYDAAQNQLNLAQIASSNAVQTQNILGTLGKFYPNAPINPYYVYGGTTIS